VKQQAGEMPVDDDDGGDVHTYMQSPDCDISEKKKKKKK
jgi:hypothetical protein